MQRAWKVEKSIFIALWIFNDFFSSAERQPPNEQKNKREIKLYGIFRMFIYSLSRLR